MRLSRRARQYWPLTIVTVAMGLGLPFVDQNSIVSPTGVFSSGVQPGQPIFYGIDAADFTGGAMSAAKLRELNANAVVLASPAAGGAAIDEFRAAGIRVVATVTAVGDWFQVRAGAGPVPGSFSVSRAASVFAEARNNGLEKLVDFIEIGGEATSYATRLQRRRMYELAREYLPNVPVVRRYDKQSIRRAENSAAEPHPLGGVWEDYRFGAGECDVALIVLDAVATPSGWSRVNWLLDRMAQTVAVLKTRQESIAVVALVTVDPGTDLWSASELGLFASSLLSAPSMDGLFLRGLGVRPDELSYHAQAAHRAAFKLAAPERGPAGASPVSGL